jgi:hypothetical protein
MYTNLTDCPYTRRGSMNSTAVALYEPPISLNGFSAIILLAALMAVSALFPKPIVTEEPNDDIWKYTGFIINLQGVPGELGKAAERAGVVYTNLYEREYPSGKFAWRVKINDMYYYLSRTLVRLKAVPA